MAIAAQEGDPLKRYWALRLPRLRDVGRERRADRAEAQREAEHEKRLPEHLLPHGCPEPAQTLRRCAWRVKKAADHPPDIVLSASCSDTSARTNRRTPGHRCARPRLPELTHEITLRRNDENSAPLDRHCLGKPRWPGDHRLRRPVRTL